MTTKEVVHETETKMKKTLESVAREFAEVRTGRAHPGLIEGMHIDYYGTPTMVKQIATITIPDAQSIIIQPWDVSAIIEIEKTILKSSLGIMPSNDGKMIRLSIPSLSKERRQELAKMVKEMAENGRVSLRTIRREANDKIKKMHTDGHVSEDDNFKAQEEIQKLTDRFIKEVDKILESKNKELASFG